MMPQFQHLTLGQKERIRAAAALKVSPETRDVFLADCEYALAALACQPPTDDDVSDVLRKLLHVNIYTDDALKRARK